ncbi:hypothetical protein [Fulvivirga imtechensis]|uniref:hypothetical protein n=1 Tax=Fulvivirga imtechensis TaxID=881893 RepID=UPI0012FCCE1E|nr:hypothetical protein [Fulvivirga imtechensis]
MTIISKHLSETTDKRPKNKNDKRFSTDLFRGPEFTGSEEDLVLLLKLREAAEDKDSHQKKLKNQVIPPVPSSSRGGNEGSY